MRQVPDYLIIGSGRVARHMAHYLSFLHLSYQTWHRGQPVADLLTCAEQASHILILISDAAIEPFIIQHLAKTKAMKIHFSGSLVTSQACGAHPLMTFADQLYTFDEYKNIPFVLDDDAPEAGLLLPGFPNKTVRLAKKEKPKYHALCVLAGNFSCLLWQKFFYGFAHDLHLPPEIGHAYLRQQTRNLEQDYKHALTGPLARNDDVTIARNKAALAGDAYQAVYQSFVDAYRKENA